MIIINTVAGLANRLRVIESGLSLAKKLNTKCTIIWDVDTSMVAKFTELFIVSKDLNFKSSIRFKYIRRASRFIGFKNKCAKIINFLCGVDEVIDSLFIHEEIYSKNISIIELCKQKTCYFSTYETFFEFSFNYSWLKPIPEIEVKVLQFLEKIVGRKCIGLHIRRTDNTVSIDQSPDNVFEEAIDFEIKNNNKVIFFLATDDIYTQQKFIRIYGNKIFTNPKKFGRESIQATQDAVVDLLSLSKCEKMYCSYWSSFSETAAVISNGEIIICKK